MTSVYYSWIYNHIHIYVYVTGDEYSDLNALVDAVEQLRLEQEAVYGQTGRQEVAHGEVGGAAAASGSGQSQSG